MDEKDKSDRFMERRFNMVTPPTAEEIECIVAGAMSRLGRAGDSSCCGIS